MTDRGGRCVLIGHQIADFATWKRMFGDAAGRRFASRK